MFDLCLSGIGLVCLWWLILAAIAIATLDTQKVGLFVQRRIGRGGRPFNVYKIRTMREVPGIHTTVTRLGDSRITKIGAFFRRTKIDELPQLWNVLIGQMSLVGPRPDVSGFADRLVGQDRAILELQPGITGPATLFYRNEEEILAAQSDPEGYNRNVIFPHKVRLNLDYMDGWSLARDISYIWQTVTGK